MIHCFTGDVDNMQAVQKRGGVIALGGISSFASAKALRQAVAQAPDAMIMIETDLPFLAPIPYRGKTCIPEYIAHTVDSIGELRKQSSEQIMTTAEMNARQFFTLL